MFSQTVVHCSSGDSGLVHIATSLCIVLDMGRHSSSTIITHDVGIENMMQTMDNTPAIPNKK